MSYDGIWVAEVKGAYGVMQLAGIVFLHDGRAFSSDSNHYSHGKYRVTKKKLKIKLKVSFFRGPQTVFGETLSAVDVVLDGKRKGERIKGLIKREDKPGFEVPFILMKQAEFA